MSKILTPRNAAIFAGVAGLAVFFMPRSGKPIETFGTQNVGDAYSRAGGSHTHLPAAATSLGNANQTASPQTNPKGIDTTHFKDSHADQKTTQLTSPGKALSQVAYGHDKGK